MAAPILKLLSSATSEVADADLVARFVAGRDEAAFAELVRRHGPAVYRTCKHLLGSSSADDAFQATFLVLACRARAVRKTASIGSWLIGVAGRVSRQMRKQNMRTAPQPTGRTQEPAGAMNRSVEFDELAAILAAEVASLPESLRDPVVLCLMEGRTHEEAAAEVGGSARTVRRRLGRARTLLRMRLERRGIVPAVAAGMVASIGPASAVPPDLVQRTSDGVFSFLTGSGAITPAAVVAKGVVGSMVKIKVSSAMAVVAAALVGLGVVWADEKPAAVIPPANLPVVENQPLPAKPEEPFRGAGQELRVRAATVGVQRTPNFIVTAPTPWMARAVANEAEYQRRELAKPWLGQALPDWDKLCNIAVVPGSSAAGGSTTMMFANPGPVTVASLEMDLRGSFDSIMADALPHEVMHTVLASHFGKPLPRWADEGIAMLAESKETQARHDEKLREILKAGLGLRLKSLFTMTEYPKDGVRLYPLAGAQRSPDVVALYAQGHSVVRFLTQEGLVLRSDVAGAKGGNFQLPRYQYLLEFIGRGMSWPTIEAWDGAAKVLYGFESVEHLEKAWLEWLKKPGSKVLAAPAAVKPEEPERIPPVSLTEETRPAPRNEVLRLNSRKFKLPSGTGRVSQDVKEVCLYISRDLGKNWEKHATFTPDQTEFVFEAPEDGLYWLSGMFVMKDGSTHPTDVKLLAPAFKLLIDTAGRSKP